MSTRKKSEDADKTVARIENSPVVRKSFYLEVGNDGEDNSDAQIQRIADELDKRIAEFTNGIEVNYDYKENTKVNDEYWTFPGRTEPPIPTNVSVKNYTLKDFNELDKRIENLPSEFPDTNPKTRFGLSKPSMAVVPIIAQLQLSQAMMDGAKKYGAFNWRKNSVSATIYYDAALRHMMAWYDGQETAEDSGIHHLGHAMACMAIVLDAIATGNLVDDRPITDGLLVAEMIKKLTKPL